MEEVDMFNPAEYSRINEVDPKKVEAIKRSMLQNGWVGMPLLLYDGGLLTGSHRIAALQEIEGEGLCEDFGWVAYEDVTDLVNKALVDSGEYDEEDIEYSRIDLQYDNLSKYLAGTWVEDYKSQLVEW
jgi:hypothetical protein